jgi:hypothetical protein
LDLGLCCLSASRIGCHVEEEEDLEWKEGGLDVSQREIQLMLSK